MGGSGKEQRQVTQTIIRAGINHPQDPDAMHKALWHRFGNLTAYMLRLVITSPFALLNLAKVIDKIHAQHGVRPVDRTVLKTALSKMRNKPNK